MDKNKIKIKQIKIENNLFIINDADGNSYTGEIIKGSVNFKVFNEDNHEVSINNIEEGDVIKIQVLNTQLKDLHKQKNSIIKKIIIKNKYVFNSESSDEFEPDVEKYFT